MVGITLADCFYNHFVLEGKLEGSWPQAEFQRQYKMVPRLGINLSGDLDLAPQGPWYGGESSDVGDLLESIARIIAINPRILVTSHRRVFKKPEDNIIKAVLEYRDIVLEREDRILKVLKHPATLDGIVSAIGDFPGLGRSQYATFYAKMMTHKHLEHMIKTGQVKKLGNSYYQHS
jgi:ribonuclease/clavin/mitogillin